MKTILSVQNTLKKLISGEVHFFNHANFKCTIFLYPLMKFTRKTIGRILGLLELDVEIRTLVPRVPLCGWGGVARGYCYTKTAKKTSPYLVLSGMSPSLL